MQKPTFTLSGGTIVEIDPYDPMSKKPLRLAVSDSSGQTRWMSAWQPVAQTLVIGGVGSSAWEIVYEEDQYTYQRGPKTGQTIQRSRIISALCPSLGQGGSPPPPPAATATTINVPPPPPPTPTPTETAPRCQHGVKNNEARDKCGSCIQRYGAFLEASATTRAVIVSGKELSMTQYLDAVSTLCDAGEAIMAGRYQQSEAAPPDEDELFMQESF